jgi:hypothetical protein
LKMFVLPIPPKSQPLLGGVSTNEFGLDGMTQHIDRPLKLYVYNHEYDVTRELTITPRRNWGGEGALGCVLGFGALHRVPAPLTEPPHAPGETLFDVGDEKAISSPMDQTQQHQHSFITPATMYPRPTPTPPPQGFRTISPGPGQFRTQPTPSQMKGGSVRHKARHVHHMNPSAMDAFMREEEQKSRALDYVGRSASPVVGAGGVPPPPRGGFAPPPPPPKATGPEDID